MTDWPCPSCADCEALELLRHPARALLHLALSWLIESPSRHRREEEPTERADDHAPDTEWPAVVRRVGVRRVLEQRHEFFGPQL